MKVIDRTELNNVMAYVLFGRQAQTFKPYINDRSGTKMPHQLFVDISNKVKEIYGVPIKWYEEY